MSLESLLSPAAWLGGLLIFALRMVGITLDTLRVLFTVRGERAPAWIAGFFETALYVVVLGSVLNNLQNPLNLIGYGAGFATGNVVGMWLENRLGVGFARVRIISAGFESSIAARLREAGFGVTEISAQGMQGTVGVLDCMVQRKDIEEVRSIAEAVDPGAFVTAEDMRPLRHGFFRVGEKRNVMRVFPS